MKPLKKSDEKDDMYDGDSLMKRTGETVSILIYVALLMAMVTTYHENDISSHHTLLTLHNAAIRAKSVSYLFFQVE